MWKAKARRVEKFKYLSRSLKKNIGALIEGWDSDDKNGDDEDIDEKDKISEKDKIKAKMLRYQRKWESYINR